MGYKSLFMLTLIALVHLLGWVLSGSEWLSLGLSPLSYLPPLTDTSSGSEEEGGQGEGTPTSSQGSVSMEHWISRAIHQGSTTSSSSSSTQSGGSGAAGRLADVLAQTHVGKSGNSPSPSSASTYIPQPVTLTLPAMLLNPASLACVCCPNLLLLLIVYLCCSWTMLAIINTILHWSPLKLCQLSLLTLKSVNNQ